MFSDIFVEMIKKNYQNIAVFNKDQQLPKPEHPLFSIGQIKWTPEDIQKYAPSNQEISYTNDFYVISLKKIISGEVIYGRTKYDSSTGTMFFWSPQQTLITKDIVVSSDTWFITFHADYIRATVLWEQLKTYSFFNYYVNEALHLLPKEETIIKSIFQNIDTEYHNNEDDFSKDFIIAHLDTLLKYVNRFYKRQFLHRKDLNKGLLSRFNAVLHDYFQNEKTQKNGIPSVGWLAKELSVSQRYLSDTIKAETGKTAIEQINLYLVNESKNLLLTPQISIAEVAYRLGFEYPNYFAKLFKKTTGLSPTEYRKNSFN